MKEIYELTKAEEWKEALGVLKVLREDLNIPKVLDERENLIARDYRLFGLSENGRFVCVAGVALHPHITRGNEFWVHDLASLPEARSQGHGEAMMHFLEKEAQKLGCNRLMVHTRLIRERAQNFYENHLEYERYAVVYQAEFQKI